MFSVLTGWLETRAMAEVFLFRVRSGSWVDNVSVSKGKDKGFWSHTSLGSSRLLLLTSYLTSLGLSFLVYKIGIIIHLSHEIVRIK